MVMIVATDATEGLRRARDLERARRQIAEQERLRTVGLLAAGIAHDFSNALHAVGMRVGMLAAASSLADRDRRNVEALGRIVAELSARTRRLRDVARVRQELELEPVELASVVASAVELARAEFQSREAGAVEISVHASVAALPPVRGATSELVHLLLNLLLNARDSMAGRGTVELAGGVEEDAVVLRVADEGTGIPHADLERIFEPFFSTKGETGTGLGLATAYGLMRHLGGEISASNRPQGGAVLTLRFRRWE
jgi:signal transduction histidine kinase